MQSNIGDFGDEPDESNDEPTDETGDHSPCVACDYRHPSNVHTEYPELDEIPEDVPIDAGNADVERAGRIVRQLQQEPELGHHSVISRTIVDYYRDNDEHPDEFYKMTVGADPDIWNFGRIGSETLARAVETFAREEYPGALRAATEQYNEELRDKCESALEDQRTREADREFQQDPPERVNGWVRFESEKPDVEMSYRCEYRGTPSVAAVYRTDDGLDAHESTLEEWSDAETAADAKVNRHFMRVTSDRGAWGSLRSHLESFEDAAEPLPRDTESDESSDDSDETRPSDIDPIDMDLPDGWELESHTTGGNRDIDGDRETARFTRSDGARVWVDLKGSSITQEKYVVKSSFVGAPQVDGQVTRDVGRCEAFETARSHMEEHTPDSDESDASGESDADAQAVATDGGQLEATDEGPTTVREEDDLPSNETVQILTGITRVFHTPKVLEGETSGTGKTISVDPEIGSSVRLDAREIFNGETEYRDGTYYKLYTPGRLRNKQRQNKQPGPRAGTDTVSEIDDLPAPTHWPNVDEPDDAPEECPHCGQTSVPWEDVSEPRCFRCGELPSAADDDDEESEDETPDKWDLSRLDRGDILSLENYGDDYVVTRVHTYVGTQTVSKVEVATREGGEWVTYKLRKVDHLGNTCFNVDREGETSVMINVDDPDHAQDFEVVDHDQDRLKRYINESYYGD